MQTSTYSGTLPAMSDHSRTSKNRAGRAIGIPESGRPEVDIPAATQDVAESKQRELGGPTGPEPTRYGDWERKGRCIDF